jgi:peptidoglycan/xylan/chitin deacetylase (PgdA/CDA1 family)
MKKGYFVVSLDYELMWGVRDSQTKESYGQNILGVKPAINEMLNSFKCYNINATFAIVGLLFHETKEEMVNNIPNLVPSYKNKKLSPYPTIQTEIGNNEQDDPYYFGSSSIDEIRQYSNHEIATHTYCHYYCMEEGQNKEQFEQDFNKAIEVGLEKKISIKSIVFPRNQTNIEYLEICKKYGIDCYRGNEKGFIYRSRRYDQETKLIRILRLIDSYFNLTGYHCYDTSEIKKAYPFNIPSSRFLRPYSSKLFLLEKLKLMRIKKAMTYAAKNNLVYHLWWHPHNFGVNLEQNIAMLNDILCHYKNLNDKYNFESITMSDLSNELIK